jgi:alkyl sulfatase BDS1-like metallo-beta-lactamase superfamily hydrolase
MNKHLFQFSLLSLLFLASCQEKKEGTANKEVSNSQKEATSFTNKANESLLDYLPFSDSTDYENARKGFIATYEPGIIKGDNDKTVYNIKEFGFLNGEAPNEANPSLWRQSELNAINGLFKVTEDIYQVRGLDLANMTLVKGKTGWIIIDPLTGKETAGVALELANKHIENLPVKAVIFTHSHMDHFGGIFGVASREDIESGKVQVYGPEGFFDHSISENVMAGNTMSRRATYMYGNLLKKDIKGTYGSGLGTTTGDGTPGVIEPTTIISNTDGETKVIDGITVDFIYTPESEAPSEMMFYFPEFKALCQSENISHTLHNLYTLRGAQVRNGQKWSQYIDKTIAKWGDDVEVSFGSHHWPTWENKNIVTFWEKQRDLYRFIHDQTLRLANQGYTPMEIAEMLKLPPALDKEFYNRGYYGSVKHDVKAQYQLYFGWFDGNPANLDPLPPVEAGKKYVEFMGGINSVIEKSQNAFDNGDYRFVAEIMSHAVFAEPTNKNARHLLADTYEQLGYQAESGPWRNFYLTGAQELRYGTPDIPVLSTISPDMIRGMTNELYFNFLGMQFLGTENPDMKYNFNIDLTDTNEKVALIVSNGTVMPRIGEFVKNDVTSTIHVKRSDLNRVTLGEITFDELMKDGAMKMEGNQTAYFEFLSKLDKFEFWFNIVEP